MIILRYKLATFFSFYINLRQEVSVIYKNLESKFSLLTLVSNENLPLSFFHRWNTGSIYGRKREVLFFCSVPDTTRVNIIKDVYL
jgi:hypothetical protein